MSIYDGLIQIYLYLTIKLYLNIKIMKFTINLLTF